MSDQPAPASADAVDQLTDLIEQVIEHYTRDLDDLNDLDVCDLAENIALQVVRRLHGDSEGQS
ncbi:hypothetical protein [Saccharothrix sp. ST-888]|uniref:hypothetical protein n=1 Tax=Saccharothrix sp. ST-888 TaxID=1427391 RepID=UPI0005EC8B2F|nr:hypothetical protein [Saccharothrix sp. ST-888]KJK55195.1 hypothetical protein UK12_30165 [Saccharothrix sp. ST-888]